MYKIAICDDQEGCLEAVRNKLEKYCGGRGIDMEIRYFYDSDELMEMIEEKKFFDIYFLDVDMPCYSGMDLVKKIREISALPIIVLLTGHERYAIEACGMNIFRYMLKGRWDAEAESLFDDLFCCLEKRKDDKVYIIQNARKYVKFSHRDIMYIEKDQKYAVFMLTDNREETERLSLQQVHRKLKNPCMYFLDKGVILNVHHIRRVEVDRVEMEDGKTFYSCEDNIRKLKQYLCTYWGDYT